MGRSRPAPGSSVTSSKFVRGEQEKQDLPWGQRSKYLERDSGKLNLLMARSAAGLVAAGEERCCPWAPQTKGENQNFVNQWKKREGKGLAVPKGLQMFPHHNHSVVWGDGPLPRSTFFPLNSYEYKETRGLSVGFTPGA